MIQARICTRSTETVSSTARWTISLTPDDKFLTLRPDHLSGSGSGTRRYSALSRNHGKGKPVGEKKNNAARTNGRRKADSAVSAKKAHYAIRTTISVSGSGQTLLYAHSAGPTLEPHGEVLEY